MNIFTSALSRTFLTGDCRRKPASSKRELARHHQVSLKTVENTYEQLLTEGYIRAEERRGYFVASLGTDSRQSRHQSHVPFSAYAPGSDTAYFADFTSNQTAIELFPYDTWAKVMRSILSQQDPEMLKTVPFQGCMRCGRASQNTCMVFGA